MSHDKDCCPSCAAGRECEDTPKCRMVSIEPLVVPKTYRLDVEPGEIGRRLYKPPEAAGYRTLLQSFGFAAPTPDPAQVGDYTPTFLFVAIVPRDTSEDLGSPVFAGRTTQAQVLHDASAGFFTLNEGGGPGLKIPVDESGRGWWLYVQVGRRGELPEVPCGFNVSFAAKRARWNF